MIAPRLAAFFFFGTVFITAHADTAVLTVQEIEKGLAYARIADLGHDAAQVEAALSKSAIILDLRDTVGTTAEAKNLAQQLEQMPPRATDHRLILINPRTAPAITEAVEIAEPRQLTVGPRAADLHVDITVPTSPEADERALAALNSGAALSKLADSNPEKKRYDEATLVKNRAAAAAAEAEPDDGSPNDSPTPTPVPKRPEEEVHDLVLERAIQLHHALLVITPQSVAP